MHRNLDRRVEVLVRLGEEHSAQVAALIDLAFAETTKAWLGQPDGSWHPHRTAADGTPCTDLQEQLITSTTTGRRRKA
jgi:polyphosphate kinase